MRKYEDIIIQIILRGLMINSNIINSLFITITLSSKTTHDFMLLKQQVQCYYFIK